MMTLREFVERVNFYEHFRVYLSNKDCLIYESYFKIHSPLNILEKSGCLEITSDDDYWNNNEYCDTALKTRALDKETEVFLNKFGDYQIVRMECSLVRPCRRDKDDSDEFIDEQVVEKSLLDKEYLECFNLYIVPSTVYILDFKGEEAFL